MVAGWVAIISVSHLPCYSLSIHSPLLAHWASHAHYSLSFLLPYSHFCTRIRVLLCTHALFRSFMSLRSYGRIFLIIFSYHYITVFHHISLVVFFIFLLYYICCLFCFIFFYLEWWSSSVHYMEDSHVISTIYPTNIDLEILSLRNSSRQREFMLYQHLGVCLSICDLIFGASLFMFKVCTFVYM